METVVRVATQLLVESAAMAAVEVTVALQMVEASRPAEMQTET